MQRPLLVTGANGVVGRSLGEAFGTRAVGLVRAASQAPQGFGEVRTGDVTRPDLGLDDEAARGLAGRVGGVVHSAAITTFLSREEEIRRVNVAGTAQALRFAERAGVPFHLISTIYVVERDGAVETKRSRAYRESKREAEELVRDARVPWSIIRPAIVIGSSRDGSISRFQGVYAAMKGLVRGEAPLVPVRPGSLVDLVPRDYVAQCVRAVVEAEATGEYWITAGSRALTIEAFVERCLAYAASRGWPAHRPRLVDAEMVHRLIMPAFGDQIDADLRARLELFTDVLGSLAVDRALPVIDPELPGVPALPDPTACLDAALAYWASRVRLAPERVPA